jgi:hypothetical protein
MHTLAVPWSCNVDSVALSFNQLRKIRLYQAFDIDGSGRVLASSGGIGSAELIEIAAEGIVTPLTALRGMRAARYVPGQRPPGTRS